MAKHKGKELQAIEDPEKYFNSLGGLHDARVERIDWLPGEQKFILFIDDLNSNFLDLPEYEGLAPVQLLLNGVESVNFKFAKCESYLNIYEFTIHKSSSRLEVNIKFWPSGQCDLQCSSIGIKKHGVTH